ncbi:4-hydroxy-3-methylbut-2-enyl diphosphate reductase [Stella sp.]|uniref:4-hydroxy-3-methylbut-2-enyl diphosphate reductase n=1 Tax=Stella sp. TaxID=2912054 RepID=UPI0035B3B961
MTPAIPTAAAAPPLEIVLAEPRGFCAGVDRAIEIVERALAKYGAPVFVRHEIVHNRHVVQDLRAKGAVFVAELDEVPAGAVTIFSAHGVARAVVDEAGRRNLHVVDATCPLVTRVHLGGQRYVRQGREVVLIGHAGHPEVVGTMGQIPGRVHLVETVADVARLQPADPGRLAFVTQTTLAVDDTRDIIAALQARFPAIVGPGTKDICYATQNRQEAVRMLAAEVDLVLVVGSPNSSNSNRLRELAAEAGCRAHLIDDADGLDPAWLDGCRAVGITAGASAPEHLVQGLVAALGRLRPTRLRRLAGAVEDLHFRLPSELIDVPRDARTA